MRSAMLLAEVAARLNREAGAPPVPSLYLFTDPQRTPDPLAAAAGLPRGSAVVYRHFGAPERTRMAARLARLCHRSGLRLFVAADPALAERVGAAGVHWPERLLPPSRTGHLMVSAAAHSAEAVARAFDAGVDQCVLGPIFPTGSSSARPTLGLFHASQIARRAPGPVIALGGVNERSAKTLIGRGFAGLAGVSGLLDR